MDVEGRFLVGAYLGGLWRCAHRLGVGRAVVGCLLAVVLGPGGAVVWLASRLGGGSCGWGLGGRLTWRGKKKPLVHRPFAPGYDIPVYFKRE